MTTIIKIAGDSVSDSFYILSVFTIDHIELNILQSKDAYTSKISTTDDNDLYSRIKDFFQHAENNSSDTLDFKIVDQKILSVSGFCPATNKIIELGVYILKKTDYATVNQLFLNHYDRQQEKIKELQNEKVNTLFQTFVLLNAKKTRIAQLYDILDDNLALHQCKCPSMNDSVSLAKKRPIDTQETSARENKERKVQLDQREGQQKNVVQVDQTNAECIEVLKENGPSNGPNETNEDTSDKVNNVASEKNEKGSQENDVAGLEMQDDSQDLHFNLSQFVDDLF